MPINGLFILHFLLRIKIIGYYRNKCQARNKARKKAAAKVKIIAITLKTLVNAVLSFRNIVPALGQQFFSNKEKQCSCKKQDQHEKKNIFF